MQNPPVPPTPPSPPTAPGTVNPPAAQAATQGGSGTPVAVTVNGTELSTFSYQQLRARGSELSRQLESATSRRSSLSRDMRRAPQSTQEGLQRQINELSGRIVNIERDIAINGQQLVIARGREAGGNAVTVADASGTPSWMPDRSDMTGIIIVFTLMVLCPIAISISRLIWKRGTRAAAAPMSREIDPRMERVEQAVDAIAIEVERISEGQRFVTQLMSQQPAIGEGAAQPVRVPGAEELVASWQRR